MNTGPQASVPQASVPQASVPLATAPQASVPSVAPDAEEDRRVAERTGELAAENARLRAEIAERDRTEAQRRQSQTIEALGQLTVGITHDFNNLLTAILGGLEVLRMRTQDQRMVRLIDSSTSAAQRGVKMIMQLKAFARRQKLNAGSVDLNALVTDMRAVVEQAAGAGVTVSVALDPAAWPVLADAEQVRAALLNLAINARQALPQGGALRIGTGCEVVGAAGDLALDPGEYGTLYVHDSGEGLSETAAAHLFEPFFSTPDAAKGSGLGLAQVHGFVRQSGGDIRVRSGVNEGTCLTMLLPRAPPPATSDVTPDVTPGAQG